MGINIVESSINSYCVFSADKKHRYFLMREWDVGKPHAAVIMLNPSYADELKYDYSSMRLMNYLIDVGYGCMTIVNLFSYIESDSNKLPSYEERYDTNTDNYIDQALDLADDIYIAWGSNRNRMRRIREVIHIIEKRKNMSANIYILTDDEGNKTHLSRLGENIVRENIGEIRNILR